MYLPPTYRLGFALSLLLWIGSCNSPHKNSDIQLLVSVDELQVLMQQPNVRLVEISKEESYQNGHIPGAAHIWRPAYTDTDHYPYGGMRASAVALTEVMGAKGISNHTHLILYDERGQCEAARLRWLLQQYGFDRVSMLNGGKQAWQAASLPLTTQVETFTPASLNLKEQSATPFLTYEDVRNALENEDVILVDTRTMAEYEAEVLKKGAARVGRIPGAIHADWSMAVNFDGDYEFKGLDELRKHYIKKGISPDKHIICYCQSGVRSAHTTFVLKELLGYPRVSNYDGSWIEWSHLTAPPVLSSNNN